MLGYCKKKRDNWLDVHFSALKMYTIALPSQFLLESLSFSEWLKDLSSNTFLGLYILASLVFVFSDREAKRLSRKIEILEKEKQK